MMIFNTAFEVSLRMMLLFDKINEKCTYDKAVAIDFIATYAKKFDLADMNLHGDNDFCFSEYSRRRSLVLESLKELSFKQLLCVELFGNVLFFSISEKGRNCCANMSNDYMTSYNNLVGEVYNKFKDKRDGELTDLIIKRSLKG